MVMCDICHAETDVGVIIKGFVCCDDECASIAKNDNNFKYIQQAKRQGIPVL